MQNCKSLKQQQGATALGMLTIIAILGLGLYAVIRLLPVYLEYYSVVQSMEGVAAEAAGGGASVDKLRFSLNRKWLIEDITTIKYDEIIIRKAGSGFEMTAEYRAEKPFIGNVSLVADFDKTVAVTVE